MLLVIIVTGEPLKPQSSLLFLVIKAKKFTWVCRGYFTSICKNFSRLAYLKQNTEPIAYLFKRIYLFNERFKALILILKLPCSENVSSYKHSDANTEKDWWLS